MCLWGCIINAPICQIGDFTPKNGPILTKNGQKQVFLPIFCPKTTKKVKNGPTSNYRTERSNYSIYFGESGGHASNTIQTCFRGYKVCAHNMHNISKFFETLFFDTKNGLKIGCAPFVCKYYVPHGCSSCREKNSLQFIHLQLFHTTNISGCRVLSKKNPPFKAISNFLAYSGWMLDIDLSWY